MERLRNFKMLIYPVMKLMNTKKVIQSTFLIVQTRVFFNR